MKSQREVGDSLSTQSVTNSKKYLKKCKMSQKSLNPSILGLLKLFPTKALPQNGISNCLHALVTCSLKNHVRSSARTRTARARAPEVICNSRASVTYADASKRIMTQPLHVPAYSLAPSLALDGAHSRGLAMCTYASMLKFPKLIFSCSFPLYILPFSPLGHPCPIF